MRGLTIGKNSLGVVSIRAHYTLFENRDPDNADPERAEEARRWLETQRRRYLDDNDFQREYECNFEITSGKRVYPGFSEARHVLDVDNARAYGVPLDPARRRRMLRAWDFGYHHPAIVVAQMDSRDRLILYGEYQGRDVDIDRFAQQAIEYCNDTFGDWTAWGWDDWCDPAGAQVKSIMSEKEERSDLDVLARYGIHPGYTPRPRKAGRAVIHQLLQMRDDNTPSLLVSRRCPLIISGMLGGYTFLMKTDGTYKPEPDDDGYFSHTQACLRYLVTGKFNNLAEHYASQRGSMQRPRELKFGSNSRGGY